MSDISTHLEPAGRGLGRHRELLVVLVFTGVALVALLAALLNHAGTPAPAAPTAPAVAAPTAPARPEPTAQATAPAAPTVRPPSANASPRPTERTYQVQPGDTLASVALRHGVDYQRIAADNGLANPNLIHSGQSLRIGQPTPGVRVIQPGDTLTGLAAQTGLTVRELRALNPSITNPDRIIAGAGLRVRR